MNDFSQARKQQAAAIGEQAAKAALAKASPTAGFIKCRAIRSITVGRAEDGNEHRDYFIDLAIPPGVPLSPGDAILISADDVVTPIVYSFWDHANGNLVITTQSVTFFELSIEQAGELMLSRGWHEAEPGK